MAKKVTDPATPQVETAPEVTIETEKVETPATETVEAPAEQVETPAEQVKTPEEAPKVEAPAEHKPRAKKPEIPEVTPKAAPVKKVKVVCVTDVDSNINGEKYIFPAKKIAEVPEDVAQILVHGGKAYRM